MRQGSSKWLIALPTVALLGSCSGTLSTGDAGTVGDARPGPTDALVLAADLLGRDAPPPVVDGCGSSPVSMSVIPGNLVVVFDQSNSMGQPFASGVDGGASGPKWQVAEKALVDAVTPIANLLHVGAVFFPTKATGNTCSLVDTIDTPPQIQIEPAAKFTTDFQAHFSAPGWTLILGTPLKVALDNTNLALPDPSPFPGQRAVVIVTDGAPTCVTMTNAILGPVQAMAARGIKTYVIGLPGSAAASTLLNAIAQAGGTGAYVAPVDASALEASFAMMAQSTFDSCVIKLGMPTQDPSQLHLIVTDPTDPHPTEIPMGNGVDGWSLSADGTTVTFIGSVCTNAKNGVYTTMQFIYGCVPVPG